MKRKMKRYAVVIVREEVRVVWATDPDSAQDIALELDGAQIRDENEETTEVRVLTVENDDPCSALNSPDRIEAGKQATPPHKALLSALDR